MENDKLDQDLEREIAEAFDGMSAEDLMELAAQRPGESEPDERGRIAGRIIGVRGSDVFVDVGGKSEGVLALSEFPEDEPPQTGQEMRFVSQGFDSESGILRLSLREVLLDASWDSLSTGDVVDARVTGVNKGGLSLDVQGMKAFMPAGQVDIDRMEDFQPLVGKKLECEVTEVNRSGRNLLLSRRRVQERKREEAAEQLRFTLAEGQLRPGVVRRLTDFGAFVDLGGIDGLLHISDMSYARLKHPSEMLKVGQAVEVNILKIDLVKDRISLGLKQQQTDPWTLAAVNYKEGNNITGRITKLMNFGAFVELEPGVEGLIPIGELSFTKRLNHPSEVVKEGDHVQAVILSVDGDQRRISLSLKRLGEDPWTTVAERYKAEETVSGLVTRIADFGAFVQLEEGIEGLVHISELSEHRVQRVSSVVNEGQVVQVYIQSVDAEQRRISLSIKAVAAKAAAAEQMPAAEGEAAASDSETPKPRKRKRPLRGGLD